MNILQRFTVAIVVSLQVYFELFSILLSIFIVIFIPLRGKRRENIFESGDQNPAFLNHLGDDRRPLFHLHGEFDFLFGGKKILPSDFSQVKPNRVVPAALPFIGSKDRRMAGRLAFPILVVELGDIYIVGSTGRVVVGADAAP
ncbi:MAG: hypothetical protein BWY50_01959 [Spirochaetes bacterium ADurb.Bin315]|nr:MAG: hypothetical protein BWY50_01959 [Spirochaetes bacterium ADurb.Bin315]